MKRVPVQDFRAQLELRSTPIRAVNSLKTGEEDIPKQLNEMKNEIREKKLLQYQLNRKRGDVNEFLKSKYSDGTFNEAKLNGYDNSESRLNHDINFEYHVFLSPHYDGNGEDKFKGQRPPHPWLVSDPISNAAGDTYIYHIPIHQHVDTSRNDAFEYKTDDGESVDLSGKSKGKGLVFALKELSSRIRDNRNAFSGEALAILKSYEFLDSNNKLRLDIPNKVVEKYLKSIAVDPNKRKQAIEYLNSTMKPGDEVPIANLNLASTSELSQEKIRANIIDFKQKLDEVERGIDKQLSPINNAKVVEDHDSFKTDFKEMKDNAIAAFKGNDDFVGQLKKFKDQYKEKLDEHNKTIKKYLNEYIEKHDTLLDNTTLTLKHFKPNFEIPLDEYDAYFAEESEKILKKKEKKKAEKEAAKAKEKEEKEAAEAKEKALKEAEEAKKKALKEAEEAKKSAEQEELQKEKDKHLLEYEALEALGREHDIAATNQADLNRSIDRVNKATSQDDLAKKLQLASHTSSILKGQAALAKKFGSLELFQKALEKKMKEISGSRKKSTEKKEEKKEEKVEESVTTVNTTENQDNQRQTRSKTSALIDSNKNDDHANV